MDKYNGCCDECKYSEDLPDHLADMEMGLTLICNRTNAPCDYQDTCKKGEYADE